MVAGRGQRSTVVWVRRLGAESGRGVVTALPAALIAERGPRGAVETLPRFIHVAPRRRRIDARRGLGGRISQVTEAPRSGLFDVALILFAARVPERRTLTVRMIFRCVDSAQAPLESRLHGIPDRR